MTVQVFREALGRILPKSNLARGIVTLMTGTSMAQVMLIALSPILTRLYSPEDFGVFALYTSICTILMVFVTGKYELTIIIPKRSSEAINLVAVTAGLSLLSSLLLLGVVLIWGAQIAVLLNHSEVGLWLYLIPLTTLILGCYHALNFWTNRRARYKSMAASRVVQSGASGAIQLAAGAFKLGQAGLILGQMLGQMLAVLFLLKSLPIKERKMFRCVDFKRMCHAVHKHIGYPKYIMPAQVMSVGATELPLLLLTMFFGADVVGFYFLALRVMAAPISLVASAVGDVYRQKAAEQYARQGECFGIFWAFFKRLLLFAFLPMLPILLFGPSLFAFVFGENWRNAGEIAALLSVLTFFQTVSSPLSWTILLPGWLRIEFLWQFSRLCLAGFVLFICYSVGAGYKIAIIAYVCVFSCLYMLHSYLQYQAARGSFVMSHK